MESKDDICYHLPDPGPDHRSETSKTRQKYGQTPYSQDKRPDRTTRYHCQAENCMMLRHSVLKLC